MAHLLKVDSRISNQIFRILYSVFWLLPFLSGCVLLPVIHPTPTTPATATLVSPTPTISVTSTQAPTQTPYVITATPEFAALLPPPHGTFFISLAEAGYFQLYAFSPQDLPLTRLTAGNWDSISPAISPDGKSLVYSSNQNGYWDLYLLELNNNKTIRLTDTPEYDGAPCWSPDGAYLAYETYQNGSLDIFIRSTSDASQVFSLTQDSAMDTSPAWSPRGRQIAFISNRSGEPEVWVADLDRSGDNKFIDISQSIQSVEGHPTWSPDGNLLAWASNNPESGLSSIYVWDARDPTGAPRSVGAGDWPVWQDNATLATRLVTPNQTFLSGYLLNGTINLPPALLPGPIQGLSFGNPDVNIQDSFRKTAQITPTALYDQSITPQANAATGRFSLKPVKGIQAPYPSLHENAFNTFQALRAQVAAKTGWDALASLENAYVPLTTPLGPGLGEDWLYTGRAFTINPALMLANWMAIAREDFGQQTYWRIYIRTTAQDGSEGSPLTQIPWDFSARIGDPVSYENGGRLAASIPPGYWFDLTTLANQYGWQRLPALFDWRTYYAGARFNELAFTQGLDWSSAMLQLYPIESLYTPTVVIPPTRTPTPTPFWYQTPTPTPTATSRPTNTP